MSLSKIKLFGFLALSCSLIACGQAPVSNAPNATPTATSGGIGQTATAPQSSVTQAVEKSPASQSSAKPKTAQTPWIESENAPDSALEMAIWSDNQGYPSSASGNNYTYARVDLNGDASPEVIVHLTGSYFCGTGGCSTLIFQQLRGQYQLIGRIPISHPPIIVSGNTSNGWNDLIVYTRDAVPMLVKFGDKGYGEKVDLAPSADLSGTYLFAKEYRKYQGAEFPLTASGSESRTASTSSDAPSTRKINSACQGEEKSLAKMATENYIINICGVTTPEYYVGTEKADPTKSIRLPLTEASPTFISAKNGDVIYTLAKTPKGNFLTVTQGEKELLREVVEGW